MSNNMRGDTPIPDDAGERDDPMMAAEFSLGLLEGEELLAARGRLANDPEFAWRREWWDDWFVPLSDDVAGAEPGDHVWSAISSQVASSQVASSQVAGQAAAQTAKPASDGSGGVHTNVIDLQARVRRWQWVAGAASVAAALALALFLTAPGAAPLTSETPQIAANDAGEPLVAQVPIGETGLRLDVTYIPETEEMLVGAIGLAPDGVHDHELWLVPGDGSALQSLGVVTPGEVRRMALPQNIATNMADGVELVLTREPIGGKPEGVDAGPVVAQGSLGTV